MTKLYPLKFTPILKQTIWGGNKLETKLNKQANGLDNIGESWELSSVPGNLSQVANGSLKGVNIKELIAKYNEELVGRSVYQKFGIQFPLLIKFIDANDDLSIQVHPDDELAKQRHNSYGKTEMWYVVDAEEGAELIVGFKKQVTSDALAHHINEGTLNSIVNVEKVKPGDTFHLPAGRIHAIGKGILIAEIQQTSDITYRVYDYKRKHANGNYRELHVSDAVEAMDYEVYPNYKSEYDEVDNQPAEIASCEYYTTNLLSINDNYIANYESLDSFVILIVVSGNVKIEAGRKDIIELKKGETLLIPALIKRANLIPKTKEVKLLEVFIE